MPEKAPELDKPVEIDLDKPMKDILAQLTLYPVKDQAQSERTADSGT